VKPARVADALARARARGLPRLDAQLLLAHATGRDRTWLIAHDDAVLDAAAADAFERLSARRAAGEPLAYLVGTKEFHGLALEVGPEVLVPRPETELLVDLALALLREAGRSPAAVDLGTGSGAIALALKASLPDARVGASDASATALGRARANGLRLGLDVDWRLGSWWEPWQGERFAVAVANPPYVAAGDPHLAQLVHEPQAALVSGPDGLDAIRAIVATSGEHLVHGGWLWVEHGHDQGEAVRGLLAGAGYRAVSTRTDLAGHPRCSGGQRV
jgi:release factor glutamine methyltransferase